MVAERPMPEEFEGVLSPREVHALQNEFLDEASLELERVMNALAAAALPESGETAVHQAFRVVHSLKGSLGVFGYDDLARLTHAIETALAPFREHTGVELAEGVDDMLALLGILFHAVADCRQDRLDFKAATAAFEAWTAEAGRRISGTPRAPQPVRVHPPDSAGHAQSFEGRGMSEALIVDSSRVMYRLLHRFLESHALGWLDCSSGAEVLERCAVGSPSVLFLGYYLPDMNAAELLDFLHAAGIAPPRIVVISSGSEQELRQGCQCPFTFLRKDPTLIGKLLPLIQSLAEE